MHAIQHIVSAISILTLSCCAAMAVELPNSLSRVAVPNGSFPLANYGVITAGVTLRLEVTPPADWILTSAECTGGGFSPWETLSVATFKAFVKPTYRGIHSGAFSGGMRPVGGSGGGSEPPPPVTWRGLSTALAWNIRSKTVRQAPDGTPDSRTTVGVAEEVIFYTEPAVTATWSIDSGTPRTMTTTNVLWTAPAVAQPSTTMFCEFNGSYQSITVHVITPTLRGVKVPPDDSYPPGQQGVGMVNRIHFDPQSVNFSYLEWLEVPGPASGIYGYFEQHTAPAHTPNANWLPVAFAANSPGFDHAAFSGCPAPWYAGGFSYDIPNKYRPIGDGDGNVFQNITQNMSILQDNGKSIVTKYGQNAVRTP